MDKKRITDFTEGNISKVLLKFSAPLLLSNVLQIVYNMVDMIIVGQKLGKVGLSAVAIGGDLGNFLMFIAMGFSNAGQVIIAQIIGEGEKKKLGEFIGTMFTVLSLCAVFMSTFCVIFRIKILSLMNTPQESLTEAVAYCTISMGGLFFVYGYNMMSAILRGMGDSIRPFFFISLAAGTNIVLDLLFVMKFNMGSRGAAIATILSQGFSFVFSATYILKNRESYGITMSWDDFVHIDKELFERWIYLGIPMAIKSASVMFSKLFVNSWINSYGVAVSAFAGIANKINTTSNLISNAFSTAGACIVGQNIGAKKYERVTATMISTYKFTLSIAALLSVTMLLFSNQIYRCFTSDSEVLAIGIRYLPIALLIFLGSSGRTGMNAFVNGTGNSKVNFLTAILDGIVLRIGLSLLFGVVFKMNHYGFWLGDALAGFTPVVIGGIFYFEGSWKSK